MNSTRTSVRPFALTVLQSWTRSWTVRFDPSAAQIRIIHECGTAYIYIYIYMVLGPPSGMNVHPYMDESSGEKKAGKMSLEAPRLATVR